MSTCMSQVFFNGLACKTAPHSPGSPGLMGQDGSADLLSPDLLENSCTALKSDFILSCGIGLNDFLMACNFEYPFKISYRIILSNN